MLVLKGRVGLHRTIQLQLLQRYYLGIGLDYRDIEWFTLEMNRDHSVIFETASKYCISDSFADHDGYSISSKGFLLTVVDRLKILQARLQQYVNHELPDVQDGFRKGRENKDQIANIRWIIEKATDVQKNIYFCFIDYAKAFDCVDHNKLWKILKEMGIP